MNLTAGNSSGVNDGAAALVVADRSFADSRGLEPLATVRAWASAGVPPAETGLAPSVAIPKALARVTDSPQPSINATPGADAQDARTTPPAPATATEPAYVPGAAATVLTEHCRYMTGRRAAVGLVSYLCPLKVVSGIRL